MSDPAATRDPDPLADLPAAGTLDADRLCATCLHQLDGQLKRKDPRLGITVVRCPECGTVSPVTEHPVTSRWARRFLAITGAAFLAASVAAFLANIALLGAVLYLVTDETAGVFGESMRVAAEAAPTDWYPDEEFRTRFLEDATFRAAIASDPGATVAAWDELLYPLAAPLLVGSVFGAIFWTSLTLHRRALVPVALVTLVVAVAWIAARIPLNLGWAGRVRGLGFRDLAVAAYGPEWLVRIGLGCLAISLMTVAIGRLGIPVLARAVLPPKILAGLASAWDNPRLAPRPRR